MYEEGLLLLVFVSYGDCHVGGREGASLVRLLFGTFSYWSEFMAFLTLLECVPGKNGRRTGRQEAIR